MNTPRWYMVTHDGAATLCVDEADAREEAKKADREWPRNGPHRAVQLVEAGFTAADMASASAQGFRDGVASAAAPAAQAEGWRLVPVEPTAEMLRAGDQKTWVLPALECWRAMLAAAPTTQPAPQQEAQEPVAWRELCRRLYVELFYCNQQMTSGKRQKWQQGKTVRDVLADAKAALDAAPQPTPTPQADSVLEDAARLDFLIDQGAYVVSDPDTCTGHWLHWARPDGSTRVQCDEHPTPRAAIDAARKQGGA